MTVNELKLKIFGTTFVYSQVALEISSVELKWVNLVHIYDCSTIVYFSPHDFCLQF